MPDLDPHDLHGIVPIIPTPFYQDETIDFASLGRSVQCAAAFELKAACLPAYGSEFYKLTDSERIQIVETAIAASAGRMPIAAQANHPSAWHAAQLARRYEQLGASLISFALPRQFALTEQDLLDYARQVCDATRLPVIVQDFNPNGSCVGADFATALHQACPNFRFLKLEDPLASRKVREIVRETGAEVGVLAGWGGMYMMELMGDGIVGVMPGLGTADLLQRVWNHVYDGDREAGMDVFQAVLPSITFSLQNLELWLFSEKALLAARGIIPESSTHRRRATRVPDPCFARHTHWLHARLLRSLDRLGMPRCPI